MIVSIYGTKDCKWCEKAVGLCMLHDLTFVYHDLQESPYSLQFFNEQGFKTVPQIYFDDEHIGGYQEFKERTVEQ